MSTDYEGSHYAVLSRLLFLPPSHVQILSFIPLFSNDFHFFGLLGWALRITLIIILRAHLT